MTYQIARICPNCKNYNQVTIESTARLLCCPNCSHEWGTISEIADIFEQCPVCRCRQFYTAKDFNHALGCLVMLVGILLVPMTFGLSLPVFALLDWLLYRKLADVICCYRCGSEFRGFTSEKRFKPFMHHIGLKYDKYR